MEQRQLARVGEHGAGLLQSLLTKTGSFFRFSLFASAGFIRLGIEQRQPHRLLRDRAAVRCEPLFFGEVVLRARWKQPLM
jgi:hypothetical protein